MTRLDSAFERLQFWPVAIRLEGHVVYTAWGPGSGEGDRFVTSGSELFFVPDPTQLHRLAACPTHVDQNWAEWCDVVQHIDGVELCESLTTVDLSRTRAWLASPEPDERQRNDVLLSLNFMWDAAFSLGIPPEELALHATGALGVVADQLSSDTVRNLIGVLTLPSRPPPLRLLDAFDLALRRFLDASVILDDEHGWMPATGSCRSGVRMDSPDLDVQALLRREVRKSSIYRTEWLDTLGEPDEPPILATPEIRRLADALPPDLFGALLLEVSLDVARIYARRVQAMARPEPVAIAVTVSEWEDGGSGQRPEFSVLVDPTCRAPRFPLVAPHTSAGRRVAHWLSQLPHEARGNAVVLEAARTATDWYLHRVYVVDSQSGTGVLTAQEFATADASGLD